MIDILLCMLLVCIIFFTFYFSLRKEILSPTIICSAVYILSLFILALYANMWSIELHWKTVIVIVTALISMGIGELFATKISLFKRNKAINENGLELFFGRIEIKQLKLLLCALFVILTAVLYLREIRMVVAQSAYAHSVYGQAYTFLRQYSWAKTLEGARISYYVQHMFTCSEAIAYVLTFVLISNAFNKYRTKGKWLSIFTIVVYLITSFMTSGRAIMLNFFVYIVCVWLILNAKKKRWIFRGNIKLIVRMFGIVAFAIILFYIAGFLTAKSLDYENFFDNFAIYFSSSIYALNEYLINPSAFVGSSSFFGIHTFSGIYSLLRKVGFSIPSSIVALEYIDVGKYTTNIYTPLRRYVQDFGVGGMMIVTFLIGFFYKRLIWSNKSEQSTHLRCILTAYFLFPLFFFSIEERVFMDVVLLRTIYSIIYVYFVYQFLVNGKFAKFRIKI